VENIFAMQNPNKTARPRMILPHSPLAFHSLRRPTGTACNLDYKYCFFLSKVMVYPGSRFRMAVAFRCRAAEAALWRFRDSV
jgi:hypothetical protein